jgi:hypothetical protein
MLSWDSSMVIKWGGDDDELNNFGGQYFIDSFFDITYEIPPERENISVRSSNTQGRNLQGRFIQGISLQGISLQGISLQGISLQGMNLQGMNLQGMNLQGMSNSCTVTVEVAQERGDFNGTQDIAGYENGSRIIFRSQMNTYWESYGEGKDLHPDFYWMAVKFKGYSESEDDLNDNDNPNMNYTRFRLVQRMNFSLLFGDDDSEIEMHADFMTKAELIGAVAVDINDSKNDQSQRSGNGSEDKPSWIIQTHTIQFNFDLKLTSSNASENRNYSLWKVGWFVSNIIENYDSSNRSAHGNESSNRVIISTWREFDSSSRYKVGINSNSNVYVNGTSLYAIISKWSSVGPTSNFKVEIEGVAAGHFTGVDNLSIEQEVIDYNNDREETSWCRVSSRMGANQRGNFTLPEVDDEVLVAFSQVDGNNAMVKYNDLVRNTSISVKVQNLTPGIEPIANRNLIVKFDSGNSSYRANITHIIKIVNDRAGNYTYIKIKIDIYEYYKDAAGNTLKRLFRSYTFEFNISIENYKPEPIYTEDFEGNISRLQNTNKNLWQAGKPSYGPTMVPSGERCIGTGISGSYSNNQTGRIILPEMDLTGLRNPELIFKHWYDIENGSDGGRVLVSSDGGRTFNALEPVGGYPEYVSVFNARAYSGISKGWEYGRFDLGPYANKKLLIAYEFASDDSKSRAGWYIDDVTIKESTSSTPGTGGTGVGDDIYEENDLRLNSPDVYEGNYPNLQCLDDDWYRIYLFSNVQLVVRIEFIHAYGDLDLEVYDSMGNLIDYSWSVNDYEEIIINPATDNIYYIYVYGYQGAVNSYELEIEFTSIFTGPGGIGPPDDIYEENDNLGDAVLLSAGTYTNLMCLDSDWYQYNIQPNTYYIIFSIDYNPYYGHPGLEVLSETDYSSSYLSYTGHKGVMKTVFEGLEFYIHVFPYMGINSYTLTITEVTVGGNIITQSNSLIFYDDFEGTSEIQIENFDQSTGQSVPISMAGYGWEIGSAPGIGSPYTHQNEIGTNLGGSYADNFYGYFVLPEITLPSSNQLILRFWHYYDIEEYYDGGRVIISTDDGQTWEELIPENGYPGISDALDKNSVYNGDSGYWEIAEFSLNNYYGEDVLIAFEFASDASINYDGWYIDDILIYWI